MAVILGNYENERLEAVATVEDDAVSAFAQARGAVEDEHGRMEAEREAERLRQREEYDRQRQEGIAAREARRAVADPNADLDF